MLHIKLYNIIIGYSSRIPQVGILSLRYSSKPGVPLASMAGRGVLNGLPPSCKDL